jgi:hypothetical protein
MKNLYLFFIAFFTIPAFAQEDIETDRPDQTETSAIVPAGKFQVEAGIMHQQTEAHSRELTLPTALWKYGVNDKFELRLITEIVHEKYSDSVASGLQPVTLGLKINLWKEKRFVPETSLLVQMQIPKLASKDFKLDYAVPEVRLLFSNKISSTIDLGYNAGAEWNGEKAEPTFEYTLSPNFSITQKLKVFIEAFGFMTQQHHPDHWIDSGLMFLLTKDIQLDLAGGYELTSHNHYHQFYETVGISFRI